MNDVTQIIDAIHKSSEGFTIVILVFMALLCFCLLIRILMLENSIAKIGKTVDSIKKDTAVTEANVVYLVESVKKNGSNT